MPPHYLSTAQVARALDCSRQYVARLVRDERLKAIRIGNRWAVEDKALERFIAALPRTRGAPKGNQNAVGHGRPRKKL